MAIAILAALPAVGRAGQIIDGGFETPPATSGGFTQYFTGQTIGGASGWTVLGKDVLVIDRGYSEPSGSSSTLSFNPNSGNNALDITGAGNTSPSDGITQTVATTIGQSYDLSFFVGRALGDPNDSRYLGTATVVLTIGDGPTTSYTATDGVRGQITFTRFVTSFVATGATTAITFTNGTLPPGTDANGDPVGSNYAGLDDVELVATPEPSTLTSAGIALALTLGCGAYRRRRARAA